MLLGTTIENGRRMIFLTMSFMMMHKVKGEMASLEHVIMWKDSEKMDRV